MPQLMVAGVLTIASAVAGSMVAALIFGKPWLPPAWAMCGLVTLETTWLLLTGDVDGPLWFDIAASASLLAGILMGAMAVKRFRQPGPAVAVSP